jgi:hypothetical protein
VYSAIDDATHGNWMNASENASYGGIALLGMTGVGAPVAFGSSIILFSIDSEIDRQADDLASEHKAQQCKRSLEILRVADQKRAAIRQKLSDPCPCGGQE